MAVKIGSNIASIQAQRRLAEVSTSQSGIYERLSSGQRINKASDDAASLAIASSLNAEAKVFTQGIKNLNDGISALSIAESALQSLQTISVRQKELAEQAASSVYSTKQRNALQAEADALSSEYNRILEGTSFNGRRLFEAGGQEIRLQAGISLQDSFSINMGAALSGTETVTAPGTSSDFTLTAGGVGEQTTVVLSDAGSGGYSSYSNELSSIDLTSITPGATFTIYDINGSPYDFEFVSYLGSANTGYTQISYDEDWVTNSDWSSLESAIYGAFDGLGLSTYFNYSYQGTGEALFEVPGENGTTVNDISGSGVTVSTLQQGGVLNEYNPNEGSLRFQAADGTNYYVWIRTVEEELDEWGAPYYNYFGNNPNHPGTGIMVDIYTTHSAESAAFVISSAINSGTSGKVSASYSGGTLTLLNTATGNVTNSIGTGYLSNIYAAGTKDGILSGQAEVSRFSYMDGSNFLALQDRNESVTINLNRSEYNQDYINDPTINIETTEIAISSGAGIATGDGFVLYHEDTAYYFDFEVDSDSSPNSGYNHIQISSSDTEEQVAQQIISYLEGSFSSQFYAYSSGYGTLNVQSTNSGYNETDSYKVGSGSFDVNKIQDGDTIAGGYYQDPYMGGFVITDGNANTYSFWYLYNGTTGSNPNTEVTASFQIDVGPGTSRTNILYDTANAISSAINTYGADFSYSLNGNDLVITQNYVGDVANTYVDGGEITATTQEGNFTGPVSNLYSRFYTATSSYYLWYRIDGTGSNPNPGGTGIQVNISSAWSASQIASAAASAVNSSTGGSVSAIANGADLTLTNASIGPVNNANSNAGSRISSYTLTPGANHTYFSSINHGLNTGDRVRYSSTGTAVGGLTSAADYYVIRDSANTFRLASSSVNALAGTSLALTSAGTGTQSVSSYNGATTTIANLAAITLDLSSASAAATSLDSVETQLQKINTEIANIGTYQSRLGYASAELKSRTETLQTAYSRIMSADVATESANLVRTQILQQSAASILAQANQTPALALRLLQ